MDAHESLPTETLAEIQPSTLQETSDGDSNLDLYEVLGVDKYATDKDILLAYERLAIKYQSTNSPEDEIICKNINKAFFVLSNTNSRRHYDETGESILPKAEHNGPEDLPESMDVTNLGGIGRVFGAMISRLGVPIITQISNEVLQTAHDICKNGGLQGGVQPSDPRLSDISWGWGVESKVDRQAGAFFRLTIEEKDIERGFILYCRSPSKGKFKLLIFDSEGNTIFQDSCVKSRDGTVTQSALYSTNFTTYRLGEPLPGHMRETDIPLLFSKLDNFVANQYVFTPGQYLICVYGDNFLGKTNFALLALHAKNDCPEVADLQDIDEKLRQYRESLAAFRQEFVKARETYEKAVRRVEEEGRIVDTLLDRREEAYRGFLAASARANVSDIPPPPTSPTARVVPVAAAPSAAAGSGGGIGIGIPIPISAGRDTIADASVAAAAAGGWIARGFATTVGQFSKIVSNVTKPAAHPPNDPGTERLNPASTSREVDLLDTSSEALNSRPLAGEDLEKTPLTSGQLPSRSDAEVDKELADESEIAVV